MSAFPLFDICERNHGGNYNSASANKFIAPKKKSLQETIVDYITSKGKFGATCQEIERDLNLKHQTASARCSELKKEHRIFWNGMKRALPGSQPANVYVTSSGQVL
jgi:hypothetical protein